MSGSGLGVAAGGASRRRSSSVTNALEQVPLNSQATSSHSHGHAHHAGHKIQGQAGSANQGKSEIKPLSGRSRPRPSDDLVLGDMYYTKGFLKDLISFRWMTIPSSSLKLMMIMPVLYLNHLALVHLGILSPETPNPFAACLFLSGKTANGKYTKAWGDWAFVLWHTVWWSLVRQSMTLYVLRPLAYWFKIKRSKIMRFTEQGYALFYFGILSGCGIYVMHGLSTWWYRTEHFWLEYPHREMTLELKLYYLMQAAYWLQQSMIMVLKVEKPRKDYYELIAHHIVTLWLIGWSYIENLTYIGVSIFVTMDVSDTFIGFSKCVNYIDESKSVPPFLVFLVVWTYMRHYLNIKILYSVYSEWHLIPEANRQVFDPWRDKWMPPWMQWQIFIPIALLQVINLLWYYLLMRILFRALVFNDRRDERSDDEEEEKPVLKDGKAE
ncbi:hypothetical protein M231_02532 [Tremella mesenterica]|uniref:TLC domain-containing protein n=1 Tax=Tremella mesenterica TaxID=5217 RepID=A0A4Q1BQP3_TREME|nr:uncharacterized protein TREMEDRAFT_40462 [Tremella mesenterica DSM 1558]EIW67325.1 hypothetical protein TREMEDRAFT_40462 [Tremella mesenterica DSM 1558]RXK40258.1 hypothetical protein M231_02532 [Tremella mesenterica]